MIFRGSRDGWKTTDYHRLCDDKGPIVVIVKVHNGRICGGYASNWKGPSSGVWEKDPKAFLFSLDLETNYHQPTQGEAKNVCFHINNGPYFGWGGSLGLCSTMNLSNYGYCCINSKSLSVGGDSEGRSELTGCKDRFTCSELEVF